MPEMFLARVPGTRWDTAWGLSRNGTNAQAAFFSIPSLSRGGKCFFFKFFAQ